ncbi:MAG TPA: cyanophycinase [Tenuifilaceae bacterium]|nr:cyanophycinase [Tenuifilaceae bacterium]
MKKLLSLLLALILSLFVVSCKENASENINHALGKLYIIGGGKRPPEMIEQLVALSGVNEGKYIVVLPFASEDVDTAAYYAMRQFKNVGVKKITWFDFRKGKPMAQQKIDSIVNAGMIYISGGDQNRFMDIAQGTPLFDALHAAYQKGAVIAGTSAGAAVQSKKMITGNQLINPNMEGYRTIQPKNIEITEGLGLLETAIIDQHFIWRSRMNRLISVAIENPNELAIGIDESTAILVEGDSATVFGVSQVLVLNAMYASISQTDSLLGAQNIRMDVFLPGQKFCVIP